jgi:thiamine pyrophosphate-dependent acetolactate synthase large subunit-like protein
MSSQTVTTSGATSSCRETPGGRIREARAGSDGRMHPYTLISAINDQIDEDTITVVDGGDIQSFARVVLKVTELLS